MLNTFSVKAFTLLTGIFLAAQFAALAFKRLMQSATTCSMYCLGLGIALKRKVLLSIPHLILILSLLNLAYPKRIDEILVPQEGNLKA